MASDGAREPGWRPAHFSRPRGYSTLHPGLLAECSRAPKQHGRARPEEPRDAVLALRRRHLHRGPKKLRAMLAEREPRVEWPAVSTIGAWLREAVLSAPRRRTRYGAVDAATGGGPVAE